MLKGSFRLWAAAALAAAAARGGDTQTGQGQTDLKQMSLEQLSAIEVTTPSKTPERAFRTPAAIYVITGDDIRRSGAKSLPEVLRLAPGVEVARIDANHWSVGIRGFGSRLSRSVLVLIDGRTVYTPLFAGTYWEVQDTLLEDVDRIEVIRGPGGTIWGPNAVDGVIDIITRPAGQTRGEYASAGGGNQQQGFAETRYGAGNGRNFDYRIYGKAYTRGPEYHPDGRNFDDWRGAQGGFRADWSQSDHDSFTFSGDLYGITAGERVQAVTYTSPYSQIADGNASLSGGNVMGRWARKLDGGGDIQVQAYFDRTNRQELNLTDYRSTFDVDYVQHQNAGARHALTWGLGLRVSPAHNDPVVSGLTFLPARRTDQLYTAFFQDQISLVEQRLALVVGTKVLRTNFTGFEFEPSTRLLWTPDDRHTVWAAFTHAVRTPSDVEENFYLSGFTGQFANGIPVMARFNANPNFAPEQMNGWEIGYRQLMGKNWLIDVASFYNHYHDLESEDITGSIFFEDNPEPPHYLLPAQFRNGLYGYTKGLEVAPEWRPAGWWRLRGTYSFLHMDLGREPHSGDVGSFPGIVGASPHHEATVTSSFDAGKSIQVDVTYRYVSSLLGVPAYSTGDARFSWRFARNLEFSVAGRNLFDPRHPEYAGDPGTLVGIERSGYLELTWRR
jgi:iron complex outermembrane receptor protein